VHVNVGVDDEQACERVLGAVAAVEPMVALQCVPL
jgi:hypothetical protein